MQIEHTSDCAVHNEPAYPAGPCDCGAQLETFTLPAGTICKRNGIPFALVEDTKISTHPGNIEMIREEFVPAVGESGSATDSGSASPRNSAAG